MYWRVDSLIETFGFRGICAFLLLLLLHTSFAAAQSIDVRVGTHAGDPPDYTGRGVFELLEFNTSNAAIESKPFIKPMVLYKEHAVFAQAAIRLDQDLIDPKSSQIVFPAATILPKWTRNGSTKFCRLATGKDLPKESRGSYCVVDLDGDGVLDSAELAIFSKPPEIKWTFKIAVPYQRIKATADLLSESTQRSMRLMGYQIDARILVVDTRNGGPIQRSLVASRQIRLAKVSKDKVEVRFESSMEKNITKNNLAEDESFNKLEKLSLKLSDMPQTIEFEGVKLSLSKAPDGGAIARIEGGFNKWVQLIEDDTVIDFFHRYKKPDQPSSFRLYARWP